MPDFAEERSYILWMSPSLFWLSLSLCSLCAYIQWNEHNTSKILSGFGAEIPSLNL